MAPGPDTAYGRGGRAPVTAPETTRVATPPRLKVGRGRPPPKDSGREIRARIAAHGPVVGAGYAGSTARAPVPSRAGATGARHASPAKASQVNTEGAPVVGVISP